MKINKEAIESILWMLLLATGPLIMEQLAAGKAVWELDLKALSTGVVLAGLRFLMNYKNPNDARYGKDKTIENENQKSIRQSD